VFPAGQPAHRERAAVPSSQMREAWNDSALMHQQNQPVHNVWLAK